MIDTHISKTMSTKVLVSVAVSTLAYQVPILINPFLAGNFLGSNAIPAVAFVSPILELNFAIVFLFAVGSSYLVSNYLSASNTEEARKHFSVATASTVVAMVILSIIIFQFRFPLADFLSETDEEISAYISEYLSLLSWSFIPTGFFYALDYHLRSEGNLRITSFCNILFSCIYMVFAFSFLIIFKIGIRSFALAYIISTIIVTLIELRFIQQKSLLKFINARTDFFKFLKKNINKGFPIMADDLLVILFFFLTNIIIITKDGASGAVIWGITSTFLSVSVTTGTIVTESSLALGYSLCASEDYVSCRKMIKIMRFVTYSIVFFIISFVLVFPGAILELFGETPSADSVLHIRLSIPLMSMFSIVIFEATNYYLLNNSRRYMSIIIVSYLGPVILLLLFIWISQDSLWISFAVSSIAGLALAVFVKTDVDKQFDKMSDDVESLDISIQYNKKEIALAVESNSRFLIKNNVSKNQVEAMEHCIDELSYNIIKHGTRQLRDKTFDLHSVCNGNNVSITFRYDGEPFNPIIAFNNTAIDSTNKGEKPQLALRVFNYFAINPFYQYRYGVNILTMSIPSTQKHTGN